MPAFQLGSTLFRTKGEAEDAIRRILHGTPLNTLITGEDLDLVEGMFYLHEYCEKMADRGMEGFEVREQQHVQFRTKERCFHVVHPNGITTDFSYRNAFNHNNRLPTFGKAARHAINESQYEFKEADVKGRAEAVCLGCFSLVPQQDTVVHHEGIGFAEIKTRWLDEFGLPALHYEAGGIGSIISDPEVRQVFREFHDRLAVRQVICKECHREKHTSLHIEP